MSHAPPPAAPPASPDPQTLRTVLGRYATGVTIVTCRDDTGAPIGLTANSFASLSLEPPLVLWSLRQASPSLPAFSASRHFAVNVLAEAQLSLSRRFASSVVDRFAEGTWRRGLEGLPVLGGCAAVIECEQISQQATGDHVLFVGQVRRATDGGVAPLLFQSGRYHMLGEIL